jgi:DeoR family transcriptional regulator, glycerol-3-phosphate regulon repressor
VKEARSEQIVALVERRGYVAIEQLAAHFGVTTQTIRRDINALCESGSLVRQHGGASLPPSRLNSAYSARHVELVEEKRRIGQAIAQYLPDRASLFIALGTTVEAVAEALLITTKTLTIVTNNTEVARMFWQKSSFETILTGGVVQHRNGGVVGRHAIDLIANFRCDYLITSAGAIEPDGTLLDFYDAELAVVSAMRERARMHLVAADHTKFGRSASQRLCRLRDISVLFTDKEPPASIREVAVQAGVSVIVADDPGQLE